MKKTTNRNNLKWSVLMAASICAMSAATAQELVKTVPATKNVYELVVDSDGKSIYVATPGDRSNPASKPHVFVFDAQTLTKKDSIPMQHGPAFGIAINNKTQTLYLSNTVIDGVTAVALESGKQTQIASGKEASHTREIIVDEEHNKIYVSDVVGLKDPGRIWVIDGKTNTLERLIETGGSVTTGIALDKKRNQLYISNYGADEIAIIDLATDKVVKKYPAGGKQPTNLAYDEEGDRLFVTNQESADVTVLSPQDGKLLATVSTGKGVLGIRYDALKNKAYVANRMAGTVSIIDAETYKVIKDIPTGTHPNTVAIHSPSGRIFITNKAKMAKKGEDATDPNGDTLSLIKID